MDLLDEPKEEKKSGLVGQVVIVAVLTLVAVGTGWAIGAFVLDAPSQPEMAKAEIEEPAKEKKKDKHGSDDARDRAHGEVAMSGHLVELTPITANIATPDDVWIRLELAILFSEEPDPVLPDQIHQDILAFIQTLKLYQMEGASGMRHLRQDMNELAKIRSDGLAKGVLIRALLLE
jgi:flagellar FliL protein